MLETATEHSYQQTVEQFQYSGITSKETIKNVVHRFNTEELVAETTRKSQTPTVLFIEADEDHVSYQDGTNCYMKLVYVHEGYETTVGKNSRKN